MEKQRKELAEFSERWKKLDDRKAPVARQVDHRLIGSCAGARALGTGRSEAVAERPDVLPWTRR